MTLPTTHTLAEVVRPRLSIRQAAETWGVSDQHIRNLIARGELPAIRIGSTLRLRPEDMEAYECRDRKPSAQPTALPPAPAAITSSGGSPAALAGYHAALRTRRRPNSSSPRSAPAGK